MLAGAEVDPWSSSLDRLRGHRERARAWYAPRVENPGLTVSELAKREGVAPARVSEAIGLLRLSPAIVADLERPDRCGPVPSVADLERLSRVRDRLAQVGRYRELCRDAGTTGNERRKGAPRQKGFQHLLLPARRYQAWLDEGTHRSLTSIAEAEGITSGSVGRMLDLLALPPESLAVIDVPAERAPKGLTHAEVRQIEGLGNRAAQLEAFEPWWPGKAAT